jgi:basic membrane protein A and related proteins
LPEIIKNGEIMSMLNRRQFGLTATGAAAALTLGSGVRGAAALDKAKVAFMYVGPVSDHGYSYQHDLGRRQMAEHFGAKVETSFVENVAEGADAERVINQLAAAGNDLIFTTSFGFMNPTLKVAQRFPKVKFEHATGYKRAANLATYSSRFYEGRTPCGLITGKMTKSNIIGYIGSFPIPEVVSGINAFTLALREVNPAAQVRVVWVNSWYDPGKEAAAAKALIDQGADILCQHTDSPAAIQEAETRGIFAFGQSSDMSRFGQKACLTSITDDWTPYYIRRVQALLDGTWTSEDFWGGLNTGTVVMTPFNPAIPADVQALATQAIEDIKSGKRHSFAGPFKDQSGKVMVAEGKTASDPDILGMAYYVEGVQGSLPK